MHRITFLIPLAACLVHAQTPAPTQTDQHRPAPPIFTALDANQDGVISAAEIASATTALKKLDKNGDGTLTPDEYRPQRPGESGAQASGPKPEGQPKPQDSADKRPRPPLDLALDANSNEIIEASELANAPALLKKLDVNGDGKLTREECLPKPPMNQGESSTPPQ